MIHSVDAEADDYVTMCGLDLDVGHLSRSVLEHMVTCSTCKAVRAVERALMQHSPPVGQCPHKDPTKPCPINGCPPCLQLRPHPI